ncbi:hypothetical protein [Roseobacter denitrificans]|uniref:Uncharacterized protein n=1 Tax=Roseobacter denitrificans (strain ATCC 33942 / OCh 114) TaxID=375451 RepID=Q161Z8_ROSDO|nr:hypothetical protein [Roseobacter denitrificans]ABG33195.1 hypothetical protein RD1_3723 [Roseobacter denitrificans OCh 114]
MTPARSEHSKEVARANTAFMRLLFAISTGATVLNPEQKIFDRKVGL